jgi:hypothetical protein
VLFHTYSSRQFDAGQGTVWSPKPYCIQAMGFWRCSATRFDGPAHVFIALEPTAIIGTAILGELFIDGCGRVLQSCVLMHTPTLRNICAEMTLDEPQGVNTQVATQLAITRTSHVDHCS